MDALIYLDSLIASHKVVNVQLCELEFLRKLIKPPAIPIRLDELERDYHTEPHPEFTK